MKLSWKKRKRQKANEIKKERKTAYNAIVLHNEFCRQETAKYHSSMYYLINQDNQIRNLLFLFDGFFSLVVGATCAKFSCAMCLWQY